MKFETLWNRVRCHVEAAAARLATDYVAAEDIQQQTAINLWLYLEAHGPDAVNPETISAWINQVVCRAFYFLARDRYKFQPIGTGNVNNGISIHFDLGNSRKITDDQDLIADFYDPGTLYGCTMPDTTYDLKEWLEKTLSPREKEIFVALAQADNQDLCEVSKKLNIPLRNGYPKQLCRVRSRIFKKIAHA